LGFTLQLQTLSVVDDAVQGGIRQSRVWDTQMPVSDGDLAGDEGGGMSAAVVEDFEQVLGV